VASGLPEDEQGVVNGLLVNGRYLRGRLMHYW
jgi:hypothetical protein